MRNSFLALTDKGGLNADAILGDNAAATVQRYYDAQRQKRAGMHVSPHALLLHVPSFTRSLCPHSILTLRWAYPDSNTAAIQSSAASAYKHLRPTCCPRTRGWWVCSDQR